MDEWMHGWTGWNGWNDGRTDRRTDGRMEGWMHACFRRAVLAVHTRGHLYRNRDCSTQPRCLESFLHSGLNAVCQVALSAVANTAATKGNLPHIHRVSLLLEALAVRGCEQRFGSTKPVRV